MKRHGLNILLLQDLNRLRQGKIVSSFATPYHAWIRALRNFLKMTQTELARRIKISQSHLAAVESGKVDPQLSTLKKIFEGLGCDLVIGPRPRKPMDELLRDRARAVVLPRLKRSMGTMALEGQAPDAELFRLLLEKETDALLRSPRKILKIKSDA